MLVTRGALVAEARSWGMLRSEADAVLDACFSNLDAGLRAAAEMFPRAAERHEANARVRMGRLVE